MKYSQLIISITLITLFSSTASLSQVTGNDQSGTTPEGVSGEAAQALGQERGQSEEEQLENILSSEQQEYDLTSQGNISTNYNFSYSFNTNLRGEQIVRTDTDPQGTFFNLISDAQHSATHNFSINYGMFNWLGTGLSIPIVTEWNSTTGQTTGTIGDASLSSRYQPFVTPPGTVDTRLNFNLSIPTGRSPFETDQDEELSTGSGGFRLSGGVNLSKVIDPVSVFGGANISYPLPITGLNQNRGQQTTEIGGEEQTVVNILKEVRPGPGFGFNMGLGYSLSYDVSFTYSFSYSISMGTELKSELRRGATGSVIQTSTRETEVQASGNLSLGTGFRISPQSFMNIGLGLGLTDNSNDFNVNVSFPLDFVWKESGS